MKYVITTVGVETEQISLLIVYICFFLIPVIVLFDSACDTGEWIIMPSTKKENGLSAQEVSQGLLKFSAAEPSLPYAYTHCKSITTGHPATRPYSCHHCHHMSCWSDIFLSPTVSPHCLETFPGTGLAGLCGLYSHSVPFLWFYCISILPA